MGSHVWRIESQVARNKGADGVEGFGCGQQSNGMGRDKSSRGDHEEQGREREREQMIF